MYLNIEGFTAHKAQLIWVVNKWRPIVICLVETHITNELQENELEIEGYKSIHAFSTSRYTGGSSIYVKKEFKFKQIINRVIEKNMWISGIHMKLRSKHYNILSLYHSPNASASDFLLKLEDILYEYTVKPDTLLLLGDFNIDLDKDTFYSRKLKGIIERSGLYQLVEQSTRITQQSATKIDLFITSDKKIEHKVHYTPKITDHSIITIDIPEMPIYPRIITYQNMHNFNELQFQLDLIDYRWPENIQSLDEVANSLVETIKEKVDHHAPIVVKEIVCKWGNKQWWTPEIECIITERDRKYKKAIITNSEDDWRVYRQQRNLVVQKIREQKKNYYQEKIDETRGDSKEMWKNLKSIMNGNKMGYKSADGIVFNGQLKTESIEIANCFNDFFIDSLHALTTVPGPVESQEIINRIVTPTDKFDKFKQLQMSELRKIVNNLNNKKSSIDGINTRILKLAFEVIGNRFLQLINQSLETGCFPKDWKVSVVVPIEKVSGAVRCEDHRPINMVATYEKLLETVVNNQVREYVQENKLLTDAQAGFRVRHSCESALQTVISKWKIALDNKRLVGVVLLDFRRAFETINRKLLIRKLHKYGFEGNVLKWFSQYLETRTQKTKYKEHFSSVKVNDHGVPQGTVLGPELFVLYINDIVKVVKKCGIQLFADDTLLFAEGDTVQDIVNLLNEDLENIYRWLWSNSLRVNIDKTKCMVLKSRYNVIDTYNHNGIVINGNRIEQVNECKYLGVIIDERLTFSSHANYISKKVSRKINLLCRMGRDLSSWTKLLIYKTIVLPHFNYCSTILYMFNKGDVGSIQRKQNQALRCILGCGRYSRIRDMLELTNLLSIKQNIYYNTMIVMYKIKNNLYPEHILNNLQMVGDIHGYNTRSTSNFYVSRVNSSFAQNNLFYKGLIDFNYIPIEIKNQNFNNFKRLLRRYVVENLSI